MLTVISTTPSQKNLSFIRSVFAWWNIAMAPSSAVTMAEISTSRAVSGTCCTS
jgi:hypothetical protein